MSSWVPVYSAHPSYDGQAQRTLYIGGNCGPTVAVALPRALAPERAPEAPPLACARPGSATLAEGRRRRRRRGRRTRGRPDRAGGGASPRHCLRAGGAVF